MNDKGRLTNPRPAPGGCARNCRVLLALALCLLAGHAAAQDLSAAALASRYAALRSQLQASPLGVPVLVTSVESGDQTRGEVHALLAQPFDKLAEHLSAPREWCQIVLLHLNIKTCTHEHRQNSSEDWLTFYSGRKVYESPDRAHPLRFAFRAVGTRGSLLDVDLSADTGPMGTSDYRITLAAVPVAQGSFVRIAYTFRSSAMSRLAISTYLATLARGKVGFTVAAAGPGAKPEHVQGRRGIVERNVVRYHLAIQAYLEGLDNNTELPAPQRFEHDLNRWFDLTERFPLQLHELEKSEYLQAKRKERDEQNKRQQALDARVAGAGSQPTN